MQPAAATATGASSGSSGLGIGGFNPLATLEGNPYFSAGFGLAIMGTGLAVLRGAGKTAVTMAKRHLLITLEGEEAEAKANLERVQRDKADLAKKYQEAKAAAMEAEHYLEIIQKKVKRFRNRLDLCPCWECRVTCCHGPCKQLEAMEAMMGPSQRAKARKLRHQYAENLNTVD